MRSIEQRLGQKLAERGKEGNLRKLTLTEGKVDFCSNDYLGLAGNQQLSVQIHDAYLRLPYATNGATGSRLISGNTIYTQALEEELAGIFGAQKALLFNSGYNVNTAILSAIPQKSDTILYDEYIHASLKEGARLSFASRFSFRHNDVKDLENKLSRATGEKFVVAESVYSMDGDFAPLEEILNLCTQYNAHLIWDEAHSTGIWGRYGSGIACEKKAHDKIFARIYTFGKALGVHGACIAGSQTLIDYLVNFARPFIYTTGLPAHSVLAIREAFAYLKENSHLSGLLFKRIHFFTSLIETHPLLKNNWIESRSPVQAIRIGGNEKTKSVASTLQNANFDVRAILSPTVKAGEERLRICLHTYNTEEEIRNLVNCLHSVLENSLQEHQLQNLG